MPEFNMMRVPNVAPLALPPPGRPVRPSGAITPPSVVRPVSRTPLGGPGTVATTHSILPNYQLQTINNLRYWADPATADIWMQQASSYFSAATATDVSGYQSLAPGKDANGIRRALLQAGIKAVGNAYRCINLPLLADPVYRKWWLKFQGPMVANLQNAFYHNGLIPPNGVNNNPRGVTGTPYTGPMPPCGASLPNGAPCYVQCAITLNGTSSGAPFSFSNPAATPGMFAGVFDQLDEQGVFHPGPQTPVDAGIQTSATENWGGFDVQAGTVPQGPQQLSNPWTMAAWQTYIINASQIGQPAGSGTPPCELHNGFPAPWWAVGYWTELVQSWQSRGGLQVLTDGVTYTALLNLTNAILLNLLPTQYQAQQGTLQNTLQMWEANPVSPPRAQAQAMIGAMVAVGGVVATAATGAIGALVVGALGAIAALFISYAPIAYGTCTDDFGRNLVSCQPKPSSAWQSSMIVTHVDNSAPTAQEMGIPAITSTTYTDPITGLVTHVTSVPAFNPFIIGGINFSDPVTIAVTAGIVVIAGVGTWLLWPK